MTRLGIDTNALYNTQAGSARYVRGLLTGLEQVAPADLEVQEVAWPVANFGFRQPKRGLRTIYRECFWAPWIAPRQLRLERIETFHSTATVLVQPPAAIRHVATLHDLAMLRHPERFRAWHLRSARRSLRRLAGVDRVICISQFTADEAMSLLNLPARQLVVVHNGCDFQAGALPAETVPPGSPLPDEFFLFVGSLEPGKNLSLLRAAYQLAREQGHALPGLVVVGVRFEGLATEGDAPRDWHYLGRIPDSALVHLYRRSLALLFPSKYEGFGLPVAEAMTLGCPVICSRVASIPEVAGEAALYADATPEAYLAAMRQLLGDASLRPDLRELGQRQAARFSWSRCARETLEVYQA